MRLCHEVRGFFPPTKSYGTYSFCFKLFEKLTNHHLAYPKALLNIIGFIVFHIKAASTLIKVISILFYC